MKQKLSIEIDNVSENDVATFVGIMEFIRLCADKGMTETFSVTINPDGLSPKVEYKVDGSTLIVDADDFSSLWEAVVSDMEVEFELGK